MALHSEQKRKNQFNEALASVCENLLFFRLHSALVGQWQTATHRNDPDETVRARDKRSLRCRTPAFQVCVNQKLAEPGRIF